MFGTRTYRHLEQKVTVIYGSIYLPLKGRSRTTTCELPPTPSSKPAPPQKMISCRLFVGAEREFPFLSPPHRFGKKEKVGKTTQNLRHWCGGWLIGKGVASLLVGAHTRYFTIFKPFSPFLPSSVYHFFLSRGGQKSLLLPPPPPPRTTHRHICLSTFSISTQNLFPAPFFPPPPPPPLPFAQATVIAQFFSPTEVWK